MNSLDQTFQDVLDASRQLTLCEPQKIDRVLKELALEAIKNTDVILSENVKDLERMPNDDPRFDRLKLTPERMTGIAQDIENVALMESPLHKVMESRELPNGLTLEKVSVPLGVVGIIYESRPNVTFDVFALCLKSGNACVLKGGSDADFSNRCIVGIIQKVLKNNDLDPNLIALLPAERAAATSLMQAVDYVDVIIPRGSQKLIDYVRQNAKVPVIETGAGIVHTYYDEFADRSKGIDVIVNAKTRRVSVCNALDCLLIHQSRLEDLKEIADGLKEHSVTIFADVEAKKILDPYYPEELLHEATEEHFGTEFLDYKMSIKTVKSLQEAMDHIAKYSSKHSEAIITENPDHKQIFQRGVDAAAVYVNASTAFTDGAQFGLGAEIGISTQKLHARGPMALKELTIYKWIITGDGHVRA